MSKTEAGAEEDWEYYSEDGEDYEWEYSEEEAEEADPNAGAGVATKTPKQDTTKTTPTPATRPQQHKSKEDDIEDDEEDDLEEEEEEEDDLDEDELEDIDLPDPFSSEPVPKVKLNGADQNGSDDKKRGDKKHKKKSRHYDKFEKFRKLEEKDGTGGKDGDEYRTKKIHVRSKDPSKIAKKFEKAERDRDKDRGRSKKVSTNGAPKPKPIEINKICKVCGKEPYLVERIVAEKSWWCKNCFRCNTCKKLLTLDTYASHQGVIYCKPHHKELFQPKAVNMDLTDHIINKNLDFSTEDPIERHRRQEKKMETIVRESRPVKLEGVVKSQVDDSKWEGLDELDVGSKFLMFEKGHSEDREPTRASDRYGIMEKLKRLQAGEDIEELLAEIDDEMPSQDEEELEDEDYDTVGLTEVQKKAHNAEKLFTEDSRKEKLALQRKKELKDLRDKLMAGTRDTILDSFDELNHKKIKKTQVDVRSENAKKFMDMFNKGEIPENISASDRITLEKEAELEAMRSKKREERNYFKKMENGELQAKEEHRPKLLVGKIKDDGSGKADTENGTEDDATLAKKFSFFENYSDKNGDTKDGKEGTSERLHAARECKARSVLNKFKDMEQKLANGEEVDDPLLMHKKPLRKMTPPRRLVTDSESEYSDSDDYSDSEYTDSDEYSSDESEEDEYLRNIREAARAKELRAKFEEWEASVGEDGGYTNLVDENGQPLETASKLKNRFERLAMEEEEPAPRQPRQKFQVRRFK